MAWAIGGSNIVRSLSADPRCEIRYVCDLLDSNIQRVENLIPIDCRRTVNANELIQSIDLDAIEIFACLYKEKT